MLSHRQHVRADIEGLRAVAILVVVAFHAEIPGFHGGFVGVDVFFVLSGYLITGLLTRELAETGRVDLRRFYARRARRLLPALALALLATVSIGRRLFSPLEQVGFAGAAVATALYASNLWFARSATDYLSEDSDTNPLLHTWSLAVEEQFYIFWPAILGLAYHRGRRPMRSLALAIWLVTIASLGASIWLTHVAQPWAFFSFPTRAWEFGTGALAAVVLHGGPPLSARVRNVVGWTALLGLIWTVHAYSRLTHFPGTAAVVPVVATALLLVAGAGGPAPFVTRLLGAPPLRWLGKMSYSWYLWHWPVLVLAAWYYGPLSLGARAGWALASLAVAVTAYHLVEDPVRRSRYLAARSARSLQLAAASTAVCAVLGLGWVWAARHDATSPAERAITIAHDDIPVLYADGCHASFFQTRSPDCVFGDPASSRTVVLFGDSHAAQWFPALDAIARKKRFRLVSLTKSACPAADVQVYSDTLQRVYSECKQWRRAALAHIVRLHPAAVFVSDSNGYVEAAGGADPHAVSRADWIARTGRLTSALRAAGARVVVIADSPVPGFDIPVCLSRAVWRGEPPGRACSVTRRSAIRRGLLASIRHATSKSALTVDLNDAICTADTCPPEIGGRVVYRDDSHLTASFAASLAPALLREARSAVDASSPVRAAVSIVTGARP